ncbi:MAG: dockerin type I domain-containing protein [Oscillospiraceae bacterium]|nr:dockerin type I domain-containing protein [Oscillospiraceae bacterium]
MKKTFTKRMLSLIAVIALLFGLLAPAFATEPLSGAIPVEDVGWYIGQALEHLANNIPTPDFGTVGGEWTVLALARAGHAVPDGYFEGYLSRIRGMIRELPEQNNPNNTAAGWVLNPATGRREVRLGSPAQSTENARLVVALTSMGIDASSFEVDGHNYDLVSVLNNRHSETSAQMYGQPQGINGPIWSQIALNSRSWTNPYLPANRAWVGGTTQSDPVTDEVRVRWILDVQLNNGGWSLNNHSPGVAPNAASDPNMTGMALQALAPFRNLPGVEDAIQHGLAELSRTQLSSGGWGSWGAAGSDVESPVQVVVALAALGIDPQQDERFVKPNGNPITAILSLFCYQTGGFIRPADGGEGTGSVNAMSTDQGTYGLLAYYRFMTGRPHLYDMRDASPDFAHPHVIPGGGAEDFMRGDINGDGVINIIDVTALRRYLQGTFTPPDLRALDVNDDGAITITDVTALRRHLQGTFTIPN